MTRLDVRFTFDDGSVYVVYLNAIPDFRGQKMISSMELLADHQPVVRMPFSIHGPGMIHTICTRDSDAIETVEW